MKKHLLWALSLALCCALNAQSSRNDTIRLTVFNTSTVFNLSKADFGGSVTTTLVAPMVRSYDTAIVRKDIGRDTNNRRKIRYVVERQCNKMTRDLRGKIAVMDLNRDCDVTLTCLLAQRAGAVGLVIIHNSNSNGNIKLPKQGAYKDSIRIPIFTVGKEKGANITALLPSAVGIFRPTAPTQNAAIPVDTNQTFVKNALEKSPESGETSLDTEGVNSALSSNRKGWFLSPNPTSDYATLDYAFSQATDVQVTILNATGQLMQVLNQKGSSNGAFSIDVHDWANGVYTLRLQNGGKQEIKKLMVQH